MPKPKILEGPIGSGWVEEVKTAQGTKFVARWNTFVRDDSKPEGRRRERGGSYELGTKVRHGEGLKSKSDAFKHWMAICDAVMGRISQMHPVQQAARTFKEYVQQVLYPVRSKRWYSEATKDTWDYHFGKLFEVFGDRPLRTITDPEMQGFLNDVAKKYSKTVVDHCLNGLRMTFSHAHKHGVLNRDPSCDLMMPPHTREIHRPWLSVAHVQTLLEKLPTKRDKLMAELLYFGAVRRGELFGLKWEDYDGVSLLVQRQVDRKCCEHELKTQASKKRIPLPAELCVKLNAWREWSPDASCYIFPSRVGTPMNYKNWLDRTLKPAATAAGIPRITYHSFRRGHATESHDGGATDKSIQAQLRHSRPDVTQTAYMQVIPESQRRAVEALYSRVHEESAPTLALRADSGADSSLQAHEAPNRPDESTANA